MKPIVRFGRRTSAPPMAQVRREFKAFTAGENVRRLCAEGEGLLPSASWAEICAHRTRAVDRPL